MTTLYNFNPKAFNSPQEILKNMYEAANNHPIICNILSTIGWARIAYLIEQRGNELNDPVSGLTLSGYAINNLYQISRVKIARITIEQGTECIKQLFEIIIDSSSEIDEKEKEREINWNKEFLELWKRNLEESLAREDLLIG